MLQPLSWPFGSRWSRRYAGAHTWEPMSPPVGVTSSKIRSSPRIGLKWTTRIMMNVVTTSVDTVTASRTTRSSGHGRRNHS